MDYSSQVESILRANPNLTDDLRADLFDMHMGNADSVTHPVLRAMALMSTMDRDQLKLAESHPTVLRALIEHSGRKS
jgi:hypothetical protein